MRWPANSEPGARSDTWPLYPGARSGRALPGVTLMGSMPSDPLATFTPEVRDWFASAFAEPTQAQRRAWPAIASGDHVLLSAPTGSGKTLAAFLWGLDRLSQSKADRTRLVYVSPLKALSYDIERNLRAPLRGIGAHPPEDAPTVAIRTGDTP